MKIKVLLADDHQIVREGLRSLLEQNGMEVTGEAKNGEEAVALAVKLSPDIVILDIGMERLNGIEAARRIREKNVPSRIIMLSMYSDKRFIAESFAAGASGYLLKECAFDEVADAVQVVRNGQTYLSPHIAGDVMKDYAGLAANEGKSAFAVLTPREREILQMLAEGHAVKVIALRLKLSVKTVETHRQHIMEKLDIHSVSGLTKYAIREGLTSVE
jgi:DNA-binding NarL/FixJ family response regulator